MNWNRELTLECKFKCFLVGRVTVDLIRRSWVRFPPRSKDFFFTSCGSLIPFTRANAQWVIHGFKKHLNLHSRVIHHLKCFLVGRVTVDLIRRSWVRFPPRSKGFFFTSCGSLIPFTRANAQWVIHGFKKHLNLHSRVNSLFHHLCL